MVTVFYYIDKILLGKRAAVIFKDCFAFYAARFVQYGRTLVEYGAFAWFTGHTGGMPADVWHVSPFNIISFLTLLMPLWAVYSLLNILLMILAGYGFYRLLLEYFEVDVETAWAGGFVFAVMSQIQPNAVPQHAFNFVFPAFFVSFFDCINPRRKLVSRLPALVILNFSFFISMPVLTLPVYVPGFLMLSLASPVVRKKIVTLRYWTKSAFVWGGYILTCAPVIYALWSFIPYGSRTYDHEHLMNADWWRFLSSLPRVAFDSMGTHYLQALFLASLPFALWSSRVRQVFWLWFGIFVIVVFNKSPLTGFLQGTLFEKMDLSHVFWLFLLATDLVVFVAIDELRKPGGTGKNYFRLVVAAVALTAFVDFLGLWRFTGNEYIYESRVRIYHFAATLAASLFVLVFLSKKSSARFMAPAIFAGIIFLCAAVYHVFSQKPFIIPNLLLVSITAAGLLVAILTGFARKIQPYMLLLAGCALLLVFTSRMVRFGCITEENKPYFTEFDAYSGIDRYLPKSGELFRVGALNGDITWALQKHGFETVDGVSTMFSKNYKKLFKLFVAPQLVSHEVERNFDEYWYHLFLVNGGGQPDFNLNLMRMANVRYLFSQEKVDVLEDRNLRAGTIQNRETGLPLYVYELKDYFSRSYAATRAIVISDDNNAFAGMAGGSMKALENTVWIREVSGRSVSKVFLSDRKLRKPARVEISRYSPDSILFKVSAPAPVMLVISNNYHPNWHAFVDGVEKPLFEANLAFQAVEIDAPGEHEVELRYVDRYLSYMRAVAAMGVVMTNLIIF